MLFSVPRSIPELLALYAAIQDEGERLFASAKTRDESGAGQFLRPGAAHSGFLLNFLSRLEQLEPVDLRTLAGDLPPTPDTPEPLTKEPAEPTGDLITNLALTDFQRALLAVGRALDSSGDEWCRTSEVTQVLSAHGLDAGNATATLKNLAKPDRKGGPLLVERKLNQKRDPLRFKLTPEGQAFLNALRRI